MVSPPKKGKKAQGKPEVVIDVHLKTKKSSTIPSADYVEPNEDRMEEDPILPVVESSSTAPTRRGRGA